MAMLCLLCKAKIDKLEKVRHCQNCGVITCDSATCGVQTYSGPQEVWICENCITIELEPAYRLKSPH